MRFTRKRLRLVSNSEINQVSSGVLVNWGNWSSCCSFRIDRRLLSHQLFLLMFDHCALLIHWRFQSTGNGLPEARFQDQSCHLWDLGVGGQSLSNNTK